MPGALGKRPSVEQREFQKTQIQAVCAFNDHHDIKFSHGDVFKFFGVSKQTGWAMLGNRDTATRRRNNPLMQETRGRKSVISPSQIWDMERIVEAYGNESRPLTWDKLVAEAGLPACGRTVHRIMGSLDYHRCINCGLGWHSQRSAQQRILWCQQQLERRPRPEDWDDVRFTDECHWEFGAEGVMRAVRQPGDRFCFECHAAHQQASGKATDVKWLTRHHTWGAVGYNFKSELVFYEATAIDHKLSEQTYCDDILEKYVKPWMMNGDEFELQETHDMGHGSSTSSVARLWKQRHGLSYHFSCPGSKDLAPFQTCWQGPRHSIYKWDDERTKDRIREDWNAVPQELINAFVRSMPQRLRDVIESGGQIVRY